jgi:hypothetical protein
VLVDAVYPETTMSMRFYNLSRRLPRNVIRPRSFYFQLPPSFELRRGFESTRW